MALNLLSAIPGVGSLVASATKLITDYFPPGMSDEQKSLAALKVQEFEAQFTKSLITAQSQIESELTARQANDMASDSWLSKNIRPMVLIYLLVMFTAMCVASISMELKAEYVELLKQMLMFVFAFYFGGRSLEKIVKLTRGIK